MPISCVFPMKYVTPEEWERVAGDFFRNSMGGWRGSGVRFPDKVPTRFRGRPWPSLRYKGTVSSASELGFVNVTCSRTKAWAAFSRATRFGLSLVYF